MSKERRLKVVEVLAKQLAKEREEELPRVSGKTRKQAIFDEIEKMKKRLTKPEISDEQRLKYEESIRIMTLAWESC